jgi:hypothetical protein
MKRKWLRALVTVALLTFLACKADWPELGRIMTQVSAVSVAWALLIYAAAQVVSTIRWAALASRLGVSMPMTQYLRLYCIGMFCNLFLPTSVGGDVVRALRLGALSGRHGEAAASVLADRLSGLGILLLLASLALVMVPAGIPEWLRWTIWSTTVLAAAGALACYRLPASVARFPGVRWIFESINVLFDHTGVGLLTILLSLVVQGLNVVLVWVLGVSLGLPVPAAFYWVLVPTVSLVTMLPVSLNGMGVREGCTVVLLLPFGVTTSQGITLAVLWFIVMSAISLTGAAFYLAGDPVTLSVRRQPPVDESAHSPIATPSLSGEGATQC